MKDEPMPARIGEELRRAAHGAPEPLKTLLLHAADQLFNLGVEFANRVQIVLLETELMIVDVLNRERPPT